MAEKKASPDDPIHKPLAGEAAEGTVDLQLEMNGVILATFTAAVVQYDRWHEFSDDIDVRMRGREQLSEIVEMNKTLGPVYDKACREIWNAQVDRGVGEIEREEHYWVGANKGTKSFIAFRLI